MRTRIAAATAALACLAGASAADARTRAAWAEAPLAPLAGLPAGPLSAKNAEFVTNLPQHSDTAGARRLGDYFYITTERDLTIYDISQPEAPRQVGSLTFPATDLKNYYFAEEDPDTNGKILITSSEGAVEVIDVSDKTAPKFLSKLPASSGFSAQHTISCVLDCTWAYGSEGSIIDLRDPANPKPAGSWKAGRAVDSSHDVTEVAPGIVLTSSQPMYLLDARADPAHPTTLATIARDDKRFNHANLWPNGMQDDIVLVGGEAEGPGCASDPSAAFQTYDASAWQQTGTFEPLDEFRLSTGTVTDGRMPDSSYCVHWFTTQPGYRNGGLVAIGWYEDGTRFLRVGRDGKISEVGWFLPAGTTASAAYWITDRIVYVADYNRGLDVIRYTGPLG